MSFITASVYDITGSLVSGTTELYSSGSTYTIKTAPATYQYIGSIITGSINNYKNGIVYTTRYASPISIYSGSYIIPARNIAIPGPSSHGSRPTKL